jgi:hypothetical protein
MTLGVKQDESLDPIYIGLLSTFAVMPGANRVTYLIEKFRFGRDSLSR